LLLVAKKKRQLLQLKPLLLHLQLPLPLTTTQHLLLLPQLPLLKRRSNFFCFHPSHLRVAFFWASREAAGQ
jgi:hypothetical protein